MMIAVRKAAAWADAHLDVSKATSLVAIVDEFASRLFAELDYVKVMLLLFLLRKLKATT
jgi:predicted unusual protein kinase regulating ubiquinone biosynthesis (AarF/ABC1/UbiB family)